ncbi:lytic murein transglycosylase [Streptomyces orinoci]|uniref:Lytic murein transglycosylase n=1 Tax=Streptomyces orinoci TaxID=67339 RepID=A0ABV3K374_STRON|nr:lytic murein transglycosylase [Streptomyces orinoci]
MKILGTRAASVSRQGLCTALLVASLSAAVGAAPAHSTADHDDPAPTPGNPQSQPHGSPNLTLPDLVPRPGASGGPGRDLGTGAVPDGATGIPATALAAYRNAEKIAKEQWPDCHVPWELIAGIGKVESEHAANYGLRSDGSTEKRIIGPALDGGQFALVRATDGGRWTGDPVYDHAIGPMQFLPSTWASYAVDGSGLGQKDPNNIFDAAAGTARYLCAGGLDLRNQADIDKAVLRYNNSQDYLNAVLGWMRAYQDGKAVPVADPPAAPGTPAPGRTAPSRGSDTTPAEPPRRSPQPSPSGPGPERPGKPTPTPAPKPTPGKTTEPKDPGKDKPVPPAPLPAGRLDRVGDGTLKATVGQSFTARAQVRAVDRNGKPVAGTKVRFEVIGDTEARFPGDSRTVTVVTGKDGSAAAPTLQAGGKAGDFTVRATVVGRDVKPVDFAATVEALPAPRADALERVGTGALKAKANASFAEVRVRALAKGKPVQGVALTATVLAADGKTPVKTGPFFKDDKGKPVRALTLPVTGEDGEVILSGLFTGAETGAYTVVLGTESGAQLVLHVTVTAT